MSVSIKHDQPAIICDVQYTGGNSRYLIFRVDFVATLINRNGFTDHQTFFLICRQEGCAVKIFDISQSLCDGFCGQGGFGISPFRSSGGSEQLCRKIFYRRIDTDPKDEVCDVAGVAHCRQRDLELIRESAWAEDERMRKLKSGMAYDVLVPDRFAFAKAFPDIALDSATIDDYMTLTLKGEQL